MGSWITVNHYGTGVYSIWWNGVSSEIVRSGTAQVTAEGSDGVQCLSGSWGFEPLGNSWTANVVCHSPNGQRADSRFRVLIGS